MIDNFPSFAKLVNADFQDIVKSPNVFVVDITGDALCENYLAAFPDGTNPTFKNRTEHDCSCCKQVVRRAGNVIAVDEHGVVRTIWDGAAKKADKPYKEVATVLRDLVRAASIADIFRVGQNEASFGSQTTRSLNKEDGRALTWNHFYTGTIPNNLRSATPDQVRGDYRTTTQVFERGLTELKPDAIDTVMSLVEANNLYRGEEHKPAIAAFQKAQRAYLGKEKQSERNNFVWTNAHGLASRFRNTVIGTLAQDLSEGVDVERAVASFESKVAPQNYKRTTALITPAMVKKAMETLETLGLVQALDRRGAKIDDISVRDVLWVDNTVKPLMKGGIMEALMDHVASTKTAGDDEKRAEEISIDEFIKKVLPETTSMEVLFKSEHLSNLMTLTAPVHPEPKQLFKWTNDFAWSYGGNVADSIKERVKKAGGNVTNAKLRVSLSWFNFDDLDLHVYEPGAKGFNSNTFYGADPHHICFSQKMGAGGGQLDVDMNAGMGTTREAVENVSWKTVRDGEYKVVVNNFAQRETSNIGFVIEVECGGKLSHFNYGRAVRNKGDIHVVTLHVKNGAIEKFEIGDTSIMTAAVSQEKWGLHTENYIKVNAITLSPNYWGDNAVGNKHTFFVLDGAKPDEPMRGIYNEFLNANLEQHRKVFEVIGDKTKCQPIEGQLSGLGFSSTKPDSVVVKVSQGKKQRLFSVKIGA